MKLLEIKTSDRKFVNFLKKKYQQELFSKINDSKKCYKLNSFFMSFNLNVEIIIQAAIKYIDYKQYNNLFYLIIPDQVKLQDFLLAVLCQIVEHGTIEIPPYPIFSTISKHIQNNLQLYFNEYKLLEGI